MKRAFRIGALGALMDEYERAVAEFVRIAEGVDEVPFALVRDTRTEDEHCRSIQTIVSHVVSSGYGYANSIREVLGLPFERSAFRLLSRAECLDQLPRMAAYTAATLEGRWSYADEQIVAVRIQSRWGPQYDLEQFLEHAIVHVLRHRRQIERFLAENGPK